MTKIAAIPHADIENIPKSSATQPHKQRHTHTHTPYASSLCSQTPAPTSNVKAKIHTYEQTYPAIRTEREKTPEVPKATLRFVPFVSPFSSATTQSQRVKGASLREEISHQASLTIFSGQKIKGRRSPLRFAGRGLGQGDGGESFTKFGPRVRTNSKN